MSKFNLKEEDRKAWHLYSINMIGLDELKKRLENHLEEFVGRVLEIPIINQMGIGGEIITKEVNKLAGNTEKENING